MLKLKWPKITCNDRLIWSWYQKNGGGDHILTQFLTLQTSTFTVTQNVLNRVYYISANHIDKSIPVVEHIIHLNLVPKGSGFLKIKYKCGKSPLEVLMDFITFLDNSPPFKLTLVTLCRALLKLSTTFVNFYH